MKIRAKLKIKGNAITPLGLSPAERGGASFSEPPLLSGEDKEMTKKTNKYKCPECGHVGQMKFLEKVEDQYDEYLILKCDNCGKIFADYEAEEVGEDD
jgi:DNA-directed RNA polymerase subunit M/transcription elongation factor TFIIS